MNEPILISYIDNSFTVEKSTSYQLVVCLGTSHDELVIVDGENQLQLLLSWPKGEANERVMQLLALSYGTKRLLVRPDDFFLIPLGYYQADQEAVYLEQLNLSLADHTLLIRDLTDLGVTSLSPVLHSDGNLQEHYANYEIWTKTDVLLTSLQKVAAYESEFLAVHVDGERVYFTCFQNRKLMYHQHHIVGDENDLCYFFLAIAEQFHFVPNRLPVYVSGKVNEEDAYMERLRQYTPQLQFFYSGLVVRNEDLGQKLDSLIGLLCAL